MDSAEVRNGCALPVRAVVESACGAGQSLGMTSEAFHDHFSAVATRYAQFRPRYPRELFSYLATLVPPQSVVWDCAAGNGQATLDLAERFSHVIATDASAQQINAAMPHDRVEYRVRRAEESGLPAGSVQLVTVAQAAHWFDHGRFNAEVKRVLQSGGFIAIWGYGTNMIEGEEVNRLVLEYYNVTVGPYWPPERRIIEEKYRHIPFPFAQIEAPPFSIEARWTLDELLGYLGTWSATNRYIRENGCNPLHPLRERLCAVWKPENGQRLVKWPLAVRIGRHEGA